MATASQQFAQHSNTVSVSPFGRARSPSAPRLCWDARRVFSLWDGCCPTGGSVPCPGDRNLRACDYAKRLRDDGVAVISGFHSPVEKECLRILLRGTPPTIICPARSSTSMRIPREWTQAIEKGRLLRVSPFAGSQKRATAELAQGRNKFVATVADRVCFIYTTPRGTLESLANELRGAGKPILSL